MNKWIGITLGSILGLSHIGMIGLLANRSKLPVINLPVQEYTSYTVQAGKDGYSIDYKANDPTVMRVERDEKVKAGFLGLGNNTIKTTEEYTMVGSQHLDSRRGGEGQDPKSVACIKAVGGGEQTGKIVGGSMGGAVGASLASVPYVGWVLAGAATMIGMDQGAEIGGNMAKDLNKNC
tara:strand:- start:57 stop:590 length:534 start_codon:yes stop_codon:yes gene_type:complete